MAGLAFAIDLDTFKTLAGVVPLLIGLVSLGVAFSAFRIAVREPRIVLAMPRKVRLEYNPRATVFYVQPSFFVSNLTTRAAVITNMELEVKQVNEDSPSGGKASPDQKRTVPWWGIVAFEWSQEKKTEVFGRIVSDAVPLPVTLAAPQSPTASFIADHSWQHWLRADRYYDLTLYVTSATSKKPLQGTVRNVRLDAKDISGLKEAVDRERQRAKEAGEEPTEEGEVAVLFSGDYPDRPSFLGWADGST